MMIFTIRPMPDTHNPTHAFLYEDGHPVAYLEKGWSITIFVGDVYISVGYDENKQPVIFQTSEDETPGWDFGFDHVTSEIALNYFDERIDIVRFTKTFKPGERRVTEVTPDSEIW